MALVRYPVRDLADKEKVLGYFDAEEGTSKEQLKTMAAEVRERAAQPTVAELSKPNQGRKTRCFACPGEVLLNLDSEEFVEHMRKHNKELNLGEDF